jgi:hypothetical protein
LKEAFSCDQLFICDIVLFPVHPDWDSLEDPSSKKSSIDLAPKTNSVTYCELIAIVVNIVDLKNALPPEWVVMLWDSVVFPNAKKLKY